MQRRSVLLLTNTYPDFDSSHRGIFVKELAGLLQAQGYNISVVTPKIFKGSRYFENQSGVRVYRFPFFAGNKLLIEYKKIPYVKMLLYYLSGCFFAASILIKNKCSLIHTHWAIPTGLIGIMASALFRKPHIVTIHGSDFRLTMEGPTLLKRIFLHVCKKANHVHCVSEFMKKGTERLGVLGEKISVFPMGVDDGFLEIGRNRVDRNHPFTIISNRNLLPLYNVSLLIRSIPRVLEEEPATRFLIAGDGAEKEGLNRYTKELRVEQSVQFLGRVPHERMPHLLAQADIYVSTSLSDGTSVSLLEAMAAGAFPMVTDIPSNVEWIVDGRNGFLVPTHDEAFLAKRIIRAIRDAELRERSRRENLSAIEKRATWPVTIERVKEIYERFIRSEN